MRRLRHRNTVELISSGAEGDLHYAVFTRELPWDHAAGVLLHTEAGGYSALVGSGGWAEKLAGTSIDDRRTDAVFRAPSPADAANWAAGICLSGMS